VARPKPDPLSHVPLFANLNASELKKVSRLTTALSVKAGTVLTRQGEVGREFFVISSGKVEVSVDGDVVATIGPGDFVGELSILDGGPRTATVTCLTDVELEVLTRAEFSQLLDDSPTLTRRLLVGVANRLREADSRISH
jgi:CRP/FNR family transcriptional regulator, cyclic AMP receptor protein